MKSKGKVEVTSDGLPNYEIKVTDIKIEQSMIHVTGQNIAEYCHIEFRGPVYWMLEISALDVFWRVPLRAGAINKRMPDSILIFSADWTIEIKLTKKTMTQLRKDGKLALIS